MKYVFEAKCICSDQGDNTAEFSVDGVKRCPHCLNAQTPSMKPLSLFYCPDSKDDRFYHLYATHICVNCESCYLVHYIARRSLGGYGYLETVFSETYPEPDGMIHFSSRIEDLSPDFVATYKDSFIA